MNYIKEYGNSVNSSDSYWKEQAKHISWYKEPKTILSTNSNNWTSWFADGELNTSYLCLDHHVEQGRGEQIALIYDSPVTNTKQKYTYSELTEQVAKFADVLRAQHVKKGDRVLIYMPMIPQAAIAMLACARLGAIHSVVFGGFAAHELAVRIDDAQPKVIVSANCGVEIDRVIPYKPLVDKAITLAAYKPASCIIYQRKIANLTTEDAELTAGRDYSWEDLMTVAVEIPPTPVNSTDPLYILYTSGTTGKPKGVVRDNGGHAVAMAYSMKNIYGMNNGDVFWAASDVGWVVGHSYIVYGPLMAGCSTILYEGKPIRTPDAGAFWRVCEEYKVNALFTAPTAFRAIGKEDPEALLMQQYDLSALKRLYLAGERLDPATYHWLKEKTQLPVIDHWWQTETGWAIASTPLSLAETQTKPGSAGLPVAGFNVEILDDQGLQLNANQQGTVAIKLPLPPGCLAAIWQNPERLKSGYLAAHPGYYVTGDGGYIDDDGYLFIMGRTDDVINVAGHRLSTGEMEEILSSHPAVAECAVIGVHCKLKGQVPLGLVVIKNGITDSTSVLEQALKASVRAEIGAIASLSHVLIVDRLPKTRSGKILRKTLRQMIDGEEVIVPSTIDDPEVLNELSSRLTSIAI